jgi:small subunit ribosomal protein S23
MGRLNLTALRVRKRAIANVEAGRTKIRPVWLDITRDIPPAQIFTRQQPIQHPLTKVRTKTIPAPSSSNPQLPPPTRIEVTVEQPTHTKKKASKIFQPVPIRYEEDDLRKQFYSDHPWELARPRVVLETSGENALHHDYSRNIRSPNAALNGESVVQRQLYLLHHVPDMTETRAYDIARKEFYSHRLREDIERRVAAEEAQAVGANFGKSINQKSIALEGAMYDDWEKWSRQTVLESLQRSAAFTGKPLESANAIPETEGVVDVEEQEKERKRRESLSGTKEKAPDRWAAIRDV